MEDEGFNPSRYGRAEREMRHSQCHVSDGVECLWRGRRWEGEGEVCEGFGPGC